MCSGSWLGSEAPCSVKGKEEERADGFKTRDEMVPCLLLSLLLGLVHVCWPDPADPEAWMNWSQSSLLCDGGPQGEGSCKGEGCKGQPRRQPGGSIISALRSCSLWCVCVAWLLLGFSATNNLASQAGLVFFSFGSRDLETSEVYLSF